MKRTRLTAASLRWLAAGLLGAGLAVTPAAAALQTTAPWFGSAGVRAIPFAKPGGVVKRQWRREAPFVRHLYRGFLGRAPSEEELRYWVRQLGKEIGTTEMVRSFMESDEFFLRQSYLGLLGREPDPAGKESYSRALRDGASRADVVESILSSEEFETRMR
jgi:hypothetical protein